MSLKIAVGLGNSGAEYALTRHNAGAIVLGRLAQECGAQLPRNKYCAAHIAKVDICSKPVILAFAEGYMNLSGGALKRILAHFKLSISETVVLYDDINLDMGRIKLSIGGSSGGHNGVADIMEKCGNGFGRIRIGIGGKADPHMDLADHVLGKLGESDIQALQSVKIKECFETVMRRGFEAAQNIFNRKDS